jgi:hypothetical protein
MSSTQSFLRQRIVGTTVLSVDGANTEVYVFVAGSGNYVGNYPNQSSATPGYMVALGAADTLNSYFGSPVFRDMGKTIYAGISTNSGSTIGTVGAFRQVQLINPVSVSSATAQTNFGVNGSVPGTIPSGNAGDSGFNSFYIAIPVGGVIAGGASVASGVGPIVGSVL